MCIQCDNQGWDLRVDFNLCSMEYMKLGEKKPEVLCKNLNENTIHVRFKWMLSEDVQQDDWNLSIIPKFIPKFHWSPHLTPNDGYVIDQHVFRSPALIVSDLSNGLIVIPDLDFLNDFFKDYNPRDSLDKDKPRWYMDIDVHENKLILGLSKTKVKEHVLYKKDIGAIFKSGIFTFGYYLMEINSEDLIINNNYWRIVLDFLWKKWGLPQYNKGYPLNDDLETFMQLAYKWAFNTWSDIVWQEFKIGDKKVGAPLFIVNGKESPNYKNPISEREFHSIWNQAWFSSLRSASGVYRYAKRTDKSELLEKAKLTKELALSAPQYKGFFPSVIATKMGIKLKRFKPVWRSKGWKKYYWGNSNRNPFSISIKKSPLHILDMSWTCLNMLRWYSELENDRRLLDYSIRYAESLLSLQDEKGYFPGWIAEENGKYKPLGILDQSPETSISVTFLLKLYEITKKSKYKLTALRAIDIIIKEIIPIGRWEDFETYWSCCRYGKDHLGKKFKRNNMHKQCNFSIFWTSEALWECYQTTGKKRYLVLGQRVLDELLMTQASWQPNYMFVPVLGGFGVMNCDGEWLDSRQSLFCELIIKYGLELNCNEYIQRGIAALRASFVMMYAPDNEIVKRKWEEKYSFFNEVDYGFMMENYAHSGKTDKKTFGSFTIYDWGPGAAAEAFNRVLDHYGKEFIAAKRL
ncbi:MAG: hypothetical protein GF364_02200 [Candidatus Lokiarchaeota archaeon]|nr:hypothetical protein [Candidatus Lokiarchaeota archaeon]